MANMIELLNEYYDINSANPFNPEDVNKNVLRAMDKEDFLSLYESAEKFIAACENTHTGSKGLFAVQDALNVFWPIEQKLKVKYHKEIGEYLYPKCDLLLLDGPKKKFAEALVAAMKPIKNEKNF